jgi:hypothetical protein
VQAQQQVASAESDSISSLFSYQLAKLALARAMGEAENSLTERRSQMSSLLQKDSETQSGGGGTPATAAPAAAPPSATKGRAKAFAIFFIVLAVAAIAGTLYWMHIRQFETTDDAQVDGHLNTISPRVEGTIIKVYVDDNQVVKAGDPLVDLDPRDYQVALEQAQAQLAQAQTWLARSSRIFRLRWWKTAAIFQAAKRI